MTVLFALFPVFRTYGTIASVWPRFTRTVLPEMVSADVPSHEIPLEWSPAWKPKSWM